VNICINTHYKGVSSIYDFSQDRIDTEAVLEKFKSQKSDIFRLFQNIYKHTRLNKRILYTLQLYAQKQESSHMKKTKNYVALNSIYA